MTIKDHFTSPRWSPNGGHKGGPGAVQVLVTQLQAHGSITFDDEARLAETLAPGIRKVSARLDVRREGDTGNNALLIQSGWACRYKTLHDGRRQILALLLPGDIFDPGCGVLEKADHSIGAITDVIVREVDGGRLLSLMSCGDSLARALWMQAMVLAAVQREWTLSLGQRTAIERLGHLFCELFVRLDTIGKTSDKSCEMPITQTDLAEATGLTSVHVNRTLQDMRRLGLIVLARRMLTIPDFRALAQAVQFDPDYLRPVGRRPDNSRARNLSR